MSQGLQLPGTVVFHSDYKVFSYISESVSCSTGIHTLVERRCREVEMEAGRSIRQCARPLLFLSKVQSRALQLSLTVLTIQGNGSNRRGLIHHS